MYDPSEGDGSWSSSVFKYLGFGSSPPPSSALAHSYTTSISPSKSSSRGHGHGHGHGHGRTKSKKRRRDRSTTSGRRPDSSRSIPIPSRPRSHPPPPLFPFEGDGEEAYLSDREIKEEKLVPVAIAKHLSEYDESTLEVERTIALDDLLPEVADWAVCAVCNEVFKSPRLTPDCGHSFCTGCIQLVLESSFPACPLCRKPFEGQEDLSLFLPNHQLSHVIDSLLIRCKWGMKPNSETGVWSQKEDGCKEMFEYQHASLHNSTCEFTLLRCPFEGCAVEFARKDKEEHGQTCPYRPTTCRKCKEVMAAKLQRGHVAKCPYTEVECKNGCGLLVLNKELEAHEKDLCPELIAPCENAVFGCLHTAKRRELLKHDCQFRAFRPYFLRTESALAAALTAITRLQSQTEAQQREIDVLRRIIRNQSDSVVNLQNTHRTSPYASSPPPHAHFPFADGPHDAHHDGENPLGSVRLSMNSL
eukprot:TRINITY_DN1335_c0_g1_i1.p1 TRINITY_DN1335_c0_g1~~TRINITY_DN1335_c0_g1_i1.p1  ORF type:complete len:473 (-),score=53.83 TRINITY_DN1335_c0_g1_i1:240-1658(-)